MKRLFEELNENDVLSGRGSSINSYSGNVQFRSLVVQLKDAYRQAPDRLAKMMISDRVVQVIRSMNPPGRFVIEEESSWVDIGDDKARAKVATALREKKAYKKHRQQVKDSIPMEKLLVQSKGITPNKKHAFFSSLIVARKKDSQLSHESSHSISFQEDDQTWLGQISKDEGKSNQISSIDLWDKGIPLNGIDTNSSLQKFHHPKRILFRELKEERTCLPPFSLKFTNLQNFNDLMKESLKSIDVASMSSVEMPEIDVPPKQVEVSTTVGDRSLPIGEKMNFTYGFSNSLRSYANDNMDSTDELIHIYI